MFLKLFIYFKFKRFLYFSRVALCRYGDCTNAWSMASIVRDRLRLLPLSKPQI